MLKSLFRFWSPIFLVIVGLSSTGVSAAPNPSFACSKRMSPDEKAICQDPRLTILDHIANEGYLFLRAKLGKAQANRINLPLIRQRQKCKTDVVCIEKAQRESIRVFNQNGARLEIPEPTPVQAFRNEQTAPAVQPQTAPEPAPQQDEASSPVAVTQPENPETKSAASTPVARPAAPSEAPEPAEEAPAPADTTAATATPASPASETTPEGGGKTVETAGAPQEPVDQPPVESEGSAAANDNASPQNDARSVAEASPEARGAREWRPEIEKEIRAESELESSTTDTLTKEIVEADQVRPLSRQERQALENTRSKHRTAFMLAAILFALVVAYAISKLRRDPGLSATNARSTPPGANPPSTQSKASTAPAPAPGPTPVVNAIKETASKSVVNARPTIGTASGQQPPGAWVWTQYKGKL